jgi:LysR family transcriptional regulator for bpeEF and oprC
MQHFNLNRLNVFKVVVLTGSFSKAALQLKIPKSLVSHQISALEADLKVPLFYRTTRSLQLTDAGRELYQNALPHLSEFQDALSFLGDTRSGVQGLVGVTVPEDIGVELKGPKGASAISRTR